MRKTIVKGMTEIHEDGRATVSFFESADASTFLHESAHVMRRHLKVEDLYVFEQWLGVRGGTWLEKHEECFARGIERFFWDGVLIPKELEHLTESLRAVYPTAQNSSIHIELPDEVRSTYARMFGVTKGDEKQRAAKFVHAAATEPEALLSPDPWFKEPTLLLCVASTLGVFLGLLPLAYGYYALLRVVICLTAVYGFVKALNSNSESWKWIYGSAAILYNPLFPVRLGQKALWIGLNWITLAVLWYGRYSLKKHTGLGDGH